MIVTPSQKIKTGLLALSGLALLGGAIFFIGRSKSMFGDTVHIYSTFHNVGGLQVGNNVRFVGVNVGTVESIRIIADTIARVDMILDKKVNAFVKKNAIASIGSDGLMGDKLIVISANTPINEVIKDGDAITTVEPADYSKTLAKVDRIADHAEVITSALAGITSRINEGKGSIGKLLADDKVYQNLAGTTEAMKKGTQGFSENMNAVKGSWLLRGYYRRKDRKREEEEERKKAARQPAPEAAPDNKKKGKK